MRAMRSVSLLAVALLVWLVVDVAAADEWIEVKSAHFTVVSNASERSTRKLVWQLEQVRSATAALWSWAKAELNKPLSVIVLKDENSMRALAPQYWEERRSVRPASVWVTAPDANYLVLRTDVEVEQQGTINPYITAYASYIDLVIGQSLGPDLPLWFRRGFTGVISNTIVRDDHILFGAPIPWELETLRKRPLLTLPKLLSVTRQSPEDKEADKREVFDAESWAFVHFLMFGDEGARADKLNCVREARQHRHRCRQGVRRVVRARRGAPRSVPRVLPAQHFLLPSHQPRCQRRARAFPDPAASRQRSPPRFGHSSMRRCAGPSNRAPPLRKQGRLTLRPPAATLPRGCWPIRTTRSTRRRLRTGKPRSSARRAHMRTTGSRS